MRAALSQLRSALPSRACEHYRVELAWLGQLSSPARDLDVYLLDFDHCKGALPTELQQSCEPLRPLLSESRDREYRLLGEVLQGGRFERLMTRLARFLGRPRKARASGRDPDSPLDQFHELRKTCKKLRYLMEFFVPLFPQQEILPLIGVLKQFQDNLGTIQDLRVQRESLSRFARQIEERGMAQPRTLEAMAWLSDHQGTLQRQAQEEFRARFAAFALEEHRRRFRTLFAPAPHAGSDPAVQGEGA
jgi:CHAD domain-containing protein